MNRNIIIGLVVVLAAAGGYYQFSMKPAAEAAAALDPANFDAAKVGMMIEASSLDAATKATLKAGVDAAATNPAAVEAALAAVKAALGM